MSVFSFRRSPRGPFRYNGAAQINWSHPLAQNLVQSWRFNYLGDPREDCSGGAYTGTMLYPNATWNRDVYGTGALLDTSTNLNRLRLGARPTNVILPGGGEFTVWIRLKILGNKTPGMNVCWVGCSSTGGAATIWGMGGNWSVTSTDYYCWCNIKQGGVGKAVTDTTHVWNVGEWIDLCMVRRGNTIYGYRNGLTFGNAACNAGAADNSPATTAVQTFIGEWSANGTFNSNILVVAFYGWTRALIDTEIQALTVNPDAHYLRS